MFMPFPLIQHAPNTFRSMVLLSAMLQGVGQKIDWERGVKTSLKREEKIFILPLCKRRQRAFDVTRISNFRWKV